MSDRKRKICDYRREFKLDTVKLVIDQNYCLREAADNLAKM
jgi:hypothetical protein